MRVIVVGAGPAGASLTYLLARRGIEVVLLERQRDFAREFRGEVLMPSGIEALEQMGLGDALAHVPRSTPTALEIYVDRARRLRVDIDAALFGGHPPTGFSQPALLEAIVAEACRHPSARFERGATARELLHRDGRVVGVRADLEQGPAELEADLVIGTDGRSSVVRQRAGMKRRVGEAIFDVVWCKLPLPPAYASDSPARGYLGNGHLLIAARAHDERLQVAWLILKGTFAEVRRHGVEQWVEEMAAHVSPDLAAHFRASVKDITHPFLLDVGSDIVEEWSAPGVLVLGDAAHVMSPVGGQGLNLALRDAIVAANHLVPALSGGASAADVGRACARIQQERQPEVAYIQRLQALPPRVVLGTSRLAAAVRRFMPWLASTRLGAGLATRQMAPFLFGVDPVRLRV